MRAFLLCVTCAMGCGGSSFVPGTEPPTAEAPLKVVARRSPPCGGALCQIEAGDAHSCVLHATGEVSCWGLAAQGQLGHGVEVDSEPILVKAQGLTDAVHIALGNRHSCAARQNGQVACWGDDWPGGALGTGRYERSLVPVTVPGVSSAAYVAAGFRCSCALTTSGQVFCWGTMGNEAFARPVELDHAVDITVASSRGCAIERQGGFVYCWGELGPGISHHAGNSYHEHPVMVRGISDAVRLFSGGFDVCALRSNGDLYCWGSALDFYEHEDVSEPRQPQKMLGLPGPVITASMGLNGHSCAIVESGDLYCWGLNTFGELGDGTREHREQPVRVSSLSHVSAVAAGHVHTCALSGSAPEIHCWGRSYAHQIGPAELGEGDFAPLPRPVPSSTER